MSFKVFGEIVDEEKPEFKEFGEIVEKEPSRLKSLGQAALRGITKAGTELSQVSPAGVRGPIPIDVAEQTLLDLIGQPQEEFAEKAIERGIPMLLYALGGRGSLAGKLIRPAIAATVGQAVEEAGGGPLAQTLAEMTAFGVPGFGKKIVPTAAQEKGVEMLRRRGLAEKEIAPLIPSEKKSAILGKLGARGFKTRKAIKRTQKALGNVYETLHTEGKELPILSSQRAEGLKDKIYTILEEIPPAQRKKIGATMEEMFQKPVKANDLMKLWHRINSQIKWKEIANKKQRLNEIKNPLLKAMKDINPQIAADFELVNKSYSKFKALEKNLRPTDLDRLIAVGEMGQIIKLLFKGLPKAALSIAGGEAGRRALTHMLINPRFQNLTRQMIKAVKDNKIILAKKINDQMKKELAKSGIDVRKIMKNDKKEEKETKTTNPLQQEKKQAQQSVESFQQ